MHFIILCLVVISRSFIIETAVENDQYQIHTLTDDQLLSSSKSFQQIMQGAAFVNTGLHVQRSAKKIDVKLEIDKLNISYVYQSSWPNLTIQLGSVTAIDFDKEGNVVLFHRADHVWRPDTFDSHDVYREQEKRAIQNNTVLALDRKTGLVVYEWGKEIFYMPHGLTIDHEDNVWLTDVALHQVFKFGPRGSAGKPQMILGEAFVPGSKPNRFCQPTSVAVLKSGDFFVADGYCNTRILKYSKDGQIILSWGHNSFSGVSYDVAPPNYFAIPHDLTLVVEKELICAADRENGRVQCFFWSNGTFHSQYHSSLVGDRLFGLDYTSFQGGQLIVVNGPTAELGQKPDNYNEVRGYVWDMSTKTILSKFGPNDLQFSNPHDVAITTDGMEIYVAEINPYRIHKFLHKSKVKSIPMSAAISPNLTSAISDISVRQNFPASDMEKQATLNSTNNANAYSNNTYHNSGATAIIVVSLMLSFALLTFVLALVTAQRRKRGCMPFGMKERHHEWDMPAVPKTDSFNLGNFIERNKQRHGFKKLDQTASDDETETAIIQNRMKANTNAKLPNSNDVPQYA